MLAMENIMIWVDLSGRIGLREAESKDDASRFLTCWLVSRDCNKAVDIHNSWGQGPAAFLVQRW